MNTPINGDINTNENTNTSNFRLSDQASPASNRIIRNAQNSPLRRSNRVITTPVRQGRLISDYFSPNRRSATAIETNPSDNLNTSPKLKIKLSPLKRVEKKKPRVAPPKQISVFEHRFSQLIFPIKRKYHSVYRIAITEISPQHLTNSQQDSANLQSILLSCTFSTEANLGRFLLVGGQEGAVSLLDTLNDRGLGASNICRFQAHSTAIFDTAWCHNDIQFLTSSGDGLVKLWDTETKKCLDFFEGHNSTVRSISLDPFNPAIFSTGSRDGNICVWDMRFKKRFAQNRDIFVSSKVNVINQCHTHHLSLSSTPRKRHNASTPTHSHSVTSVSYLHHTYHTLMSAGAVDGKIKYWDLRSSGGHGSHQHKEHPQPILEYTPSNSSERVHGIVSMTLDPVNHHIYAACSDDTIYKLDSKDPSYILKKMNSPDFYGGKSYYSKLSVDSNLNLLAAGSSSNLAVIWDTKDSKHTPEDVDSNAHVLARHLGEVNDLCWSKAEPGTLATTSDDRTVKLWKHDRNIAQSFYDKIGSDSTLCVEQLRGLEHSVAFSTSRIQKESS